MDPLAFTHVPIVPAPMIIWAAREAATLAWSAVAPEPAGIATQDPVPTADMPNELRVTLAPIAKPVAAGYVQV